MKKFMTLAAMFAAVMMSFSACEKTPVQGGDNNDGGNTETPADVCPDCQKNPCECEPEYVSPLTMDGDFADWDALDASKVAVTKCATDAKYTALKVAKVYVDQVYINVYFEYDESQLGDLSYIPFDMYLDQEGEDGVGDDYYVGQTGVDYLFEAAVIAEGACVSYDPDMFIYMGSREAWEWGWEAHLEAGLGLCQGAGANGKYEFAILKEMLMGVELGEQFGLGFMIATPDWATVGCLPNVDVTDENPNGKASLLKVTDVK
jgi:hypothetical protein